MRRLRGWLFGKYGGGDPCCGEARDWFEEKEGERLNEMRSYARDSGLKAMGIVGRERREMVGGGDFDEMRRRDRREGWWWENEAVVERV